MHADSVITDDEVTMHFAVAFVLLDPAGHLSIVLGH